MNTPLKQGPKGVSRLERLNRLNYYDQRIPIAGVDLNFEGERFDAIDRSGENLSQHASVMVKTWEKRNREFEFGERPRRVSARCWASRGFTGGAGGL